MLDDAVQSVQITIDIVSKRTAINVWRYCELNVSGKTNFMTESGNTGNGLCTISRTVKFLGAAFSLQSVIRHLPNLAGLRVFAVQLALIVKHGVKTTLIQRPGRMSESFNRLFLPQAPNLYRRGHPLPVQYLAQHIGVQALVGDETFAPLCQFAFEHVAHPFLTFLDFGLVRRFQGKPNRQLIIDISEQIELVTKPKISLSCAAGRSDRCSDTRACRNGRPGPRSCPCRQYRCRLNAI